MLQREEWFNCVLAALQKAQPDEPGALDLASYYYTADSRLRPLVDKLKQLKQTKRLSLSKRQEAGKLMEQIVYLVFAGLSGVTSIKGFQSSGPQYDLLVSGDDVSWLWLCKLLYLAEQQRGFLIEAKAITNRLPDKEFARLCAIMQTNLSTAGLGIFFTVHGASGFPEGRVRQRAIRDCRLRQVLFHCRYNKAVIVLDIKDIERLCSNGTLVALLVRKIRDISELTGLDLGAADAPLEVDLPPHLQRLR